LFLYHTNHFTNQLVIALLMGESVTGIYYLIEKRMSEQLKVFRLPLLLTLTYLFYSSLTLTVELAPVLVAVVVWVVFSAVFIHRANPKLASSFKKIIECCSAW